MITIHRFTFATMIIFIFVLGVVFGVCFQKAILSPISAPEKRLQKAIVSLDTIPIPIGELVKLSAAIHKAANHTGFEPELLLALNYSESTLNRKALSRSGKYVGYAQVPYRLWGTEDNVMMGALILKEKYFLSKGDMFQAIRRYKDGNSGQARYVLSLYQKLRYPEAKG